MNTKQFEIRLKEHELQKTCSKIITIVIYENIHEIDAIQRNESEAKRFENEYTN